jgi:hypothetical protein
MSMHSGDDGEYAVVWPRAPRTAKLTRLAERYDTLRGKTIAQLWDYIFRGDEIFPLLEVELARTADVCSRCVLHFWRPSMKWRETGRLSGSGSGTCSGRPDAGAATAAKSAD